MNQTLSFCDEPMTGGRTARLLFVLASGEIVQFGGKSIPKVCAITSSSFRKNGKWSGTTYALALGAGVRAVDVSAPLHGTPFNSASSWSEALQAVNLRYGEPLLPATTEDQLRAFLAAQGDGTAWRKCAARWDETAAALAAL